VDVDDVDDGAAGEREVRRRLLGEEQGSAQVRAEQLVPVARFDRADARGIERRGVVDEEIQAPEALARRADERLRRDRREQVGAHAHGASGAHGVQLLLQLQHRGIRAAVVQHDVGAGRVQAPRDRRADALRRAGDDRRLARQRFVGHAGILG